MNSASISPPIDSRACDNCGSHDAKPKWTRDGYDIVECRGCGLVYVAQNVTREILDEYYGSAYYEGNGTAYNGYLARAQSRKHHYRSLLPAIKKHLGSDNGEVRVLDIGCAAGYFLEVAQENGWRAQGIELSPYMSAYARDKRGLDVQTGTIEEADLPLGAFDLITMWDVIEHVQNPSQVLQRAGELLKPGGLLVAATGDVAGMTARIHGEKWHLIAPPGHLFYFSRRTLGAMLQKSGLNVVDYQSDGAFLRNGRKAKPSPLTRAWRKVRGNRLTNALWRKLKWGSILTIYARKGA